MPPAAWRSCEWRTGSFVDVEDQGRAAVNFRAGRRYRREASWSAELRHHLQQQLAVGTVRTTGWKEETLIGLFLSTGSSPNSPHAARQTCRSSGIVVLLGPEILFGRLLLQHDDIPLHCSVLPVSTLGPPQRSASSE